MSDLKVGMHQIDIKPLSVNRRSTITKGRMSKGRYIKPQIKKTKEFSRYCKDLQIILPRLNQDLTGELRLSLEVGFSNNASDLDNIIKPFQDALQIKYEFNDSQIHEIRALKLKAPKGKEFIRFLLEQINV